MKRLIILFSLVSFLFIMGCTGKVEFILKGSYQSEPQEDGYIIQMSFNEEEGTSVQYVDNREVDSGTYEKSDMNIYQISSDKQNYEVTLDDVPTYFSKEFGDEEYKVLLEDH